MADLDDFFAKKDRKKGKGKKLTPEELVKKLETDTKAKKEKPMTTISEGGVQEEVKQEDEWKEVEVEQKDYTGLKIKQLTITDEEQNKANLGYDNDGQDGQTDEGLASENSEKDGPWKKPNQAAVAKPKAPAPKAEEKHVPKVYVSPALRAQMGQPSKPKLKKGVLPDIKSEEYFPTLGTEKPEEIKDSTPSSFEEVKHGNRVMNVSAGAAPLSVGNRFTSLSNDTS